VSPERIGVRPCREGGGVFLAIGDPAVQPLVEALVDVGEARAVAAALLEAATACEGSGE
jgi:hypothetical protein